MTGSERPRPVNPHRLINPPGWRRPGGYANAILAEGRMLFLGGQVGWNHDEVFESADFVAQADRCLANITEILAAAGAAPEHLVRLTWFVLDKAEYLDRRAALGQVWRARMGRHYPAMSLVVVAGLVEDGARLEIEATAVLPHLDETATP